MEKDCPAINQIPGSALSGYFVPQNTKTNNIDAKAISSRVKGLGNYQVMIKRNVIEECGFGEVLFVWKADSNLQLDDSSWRGTLGKLPDEDK
jgi:hypothetical protein